jgi:hypothetical protein
MTAEQQIQTQTGFHKHTAIIQRLKKIQKEKQGLPLAYMQMIETAKNECLKLYNSLKEGLTR